VNDGLARALSQVRVVLADANILYSRVLRDYVLYAAEVGAITVAWSQAILDEALEHLVANREAFTGESADALERALNQTYPNALVFPAAEDYERICDVPMPDGDDRYVLAAAVAVEADLLCTANVKDFPSEPISRLGIEVITPDALLMRLVRDLPLKMLTAHRATVAFFPGSSDASTLAALERAGAPGASHAIGRLLNEPPQAGL
jgi:predicted nucleic acid-binding protein